MKQRTLSILLLAGNIKHPNEYIRPEFFANSDFKSTELPSYPGWWLYIKTPRNHTPTWAEFFEDVLDKEIFGRVASSSAVLIVPVFSGHAAVTFGQGRSLLSREFIVDDFGLKAALNAVGESSLRSIDKETFDHISSQARLQSSKEAGAFDFGLDVENDLLRAVTGVPEDPNLGLRLAGMDALCITSRVSLSELEDLLLLADDTYQQNRYLEKFPWIDNVRLVKSREALCRLDEYLLARLGMGDRTSFWLAPAGIVNWQDVRFFTYSRARTAKEFSDISWDTYFRFANQKPDAVDLSRKEVYCWGDDQRLIHAWRLRDCIYGECDFEESHYVLSSGKWYWVDKGFTERVRAEVAKIPRCCNLLPEYDDDSEGEYNLRVANDSVPAYLLLDAQLVVWGGGRSRIEICDLFRPSEKMIHVKRAGGPREFSHLFAQAVVSGELLRNEPDFRTAAQAQILKSCGEVVDFSNFRAEDYEIVLAIVDEEGDGLTLPFFAQVNLKSCYHRLRNWGYRVSMTFVKVSELRAKTIRNLRKATD